MYLNVYVYIWQSVNAPNGEDTESHYFSLYYLFVFVSFCSLFHESQYNALFPLIKPRSAQERKSTRNRRFLVPRSLSRRYHLHVILTSISSVRTNRLNAYRNLKYVSSGLSIPSGLFSTSKNSLFSDI